MSIHAKLSTVNEAINDLKETQEKILRKLQMNSGDTVSFHVKRHFEKIEVILSELEDKFGKHNTALQEVNNKVVSLVEKVGDIATDIKYLQIYTINTKLLDVKLDKKTCQGDKLQNTTTITPIEQCKIIENSPKPNENIEELCEDAVSVEFIESSYSHFEVGISNLSSAVQAQPYDRQNEFDNKEYLSSEKSQTNRGTNDTGNKDNSSSEEIKLDITNDPEYTDKLSSEETQKGDFDNKDLLSSDETQQVENTNVSQGTDLTHQRKQRLESVQIDINKNHDQGFAGKTPNETDSTDTDRRNRTELKDKSSSMSVQTVCRNDLGYKRKRSEMSYDNRVAYHSTVFQGNDTKSAVQLTQEPILNPNMKVKSSLAGRKPGKKEVPPMRKKVVKDELYGLNQDDISQPRNIREWLAFSEQLRINSLLKLQSGKIQRGSHGHDVTLVLDCSEHMRGQKFSTMIMAAEKYVNGIKQVRMTRMLEDNIGLAVFGGTSGLIVESTSNYDLVLEQIYELRPNGEAPLVGGFLMGLAGVLGIGATSQILETEVPGYMIVFTDGMSGNTSTAIENEFDIDPLYFTGDFHRQAEISSVISQIANHSIKIFYVPIGQNSSNELMEKAVRETRGKIIPLNELHRLIKMTQVLILAAQVASDLKHTNPNPTAEDVRVSIYQRTSNPDDAHDDCVDLVLEFIDPLCTERNRGKYDELKCRTLQLGDRVRRGPDWSFEEQDSHLAGTVVGQEPGSKSIWVEWDSGDLNVYLYDERNNMYSIQKVQEPRVLSDEMVAVGCKVTRGNDWTYDDADGGPGSVGTVLRVQQDGSVLVRWNSKKTVEYKMGMDGLFEIQLCNDSSNSKPAYKADINTDKYQSVDSSIVDSTASKEKKTRSSDKNMQHPWLVDDDQFHCMLLQGEYLSYENRLSLGGPCRAGKSTLASVLIGEEIPLQWNSTNGLVIYFGRNGIDIENKKMVPLQEGERGHCVLADVLRGTPIVDKESDQTTKQKKHTSGRKVRAEVNTILTSELPTNLTQDDNEATKYSTNQFATKINVSNTKTDIKHPSTYMSTEGMPSASNDYQTLDCQKLQLRSDILEEVRNGRYRIKIAPSDIIDFGGQKSYDMTHQLFIQHRGSYLLMFDGRLGLHKELDEYPEGVTAACICLLYLIGILWLPVSKQDLHSIGPIQDNFE